MQNCERFTKWQKFVLINLKTLADDNQNFSLNDYFRRFFNAEYIVGKRENAGHPLVQCFQKPSSFRVIKIKDFVAIG